MQPIYIERPAWMRYEDKNAQTEPIETVRRRVENYRGQDYVIDTLRWNGTAAIDILVMGDGYTAQEQSKFTSDARLCTDHLFETSPFDRYTDFFNVFALHINRGKAVRINDSHVGREAIAKEIKKIRQ